MRRYLYLLTALLLSSFAGIGLIMCVVLHPAFGIPAFMVITIGVTALATEDW